MIVREGKIGRVFTARLEDGDRLPGSIEQMAADNGVEAGVCMLIGGAGGGELVVGPKDGAAEAIEPMIAGLADVHTDVVGLDVDDYSHVRSDETAVGLEVYLD